jgi:hypothetical protein
MNLPEETTDMRRLEEVIIRPPVIPGTVINPHNAAKHLLE